MHEFFRIIDEQANHMRGLLADLLDQGRIETGTVSLAPEPAEVADLVEQAKRTAQGDGTHALSIDLPDGLTAGDGGRPVWVSVQALREGPQRPTRLRTVGRGMVVGSHGSGRPSSRGHASASCAS